MGTAQEVCETTQAAQTSAANTLVPSEQARVMSGTVAGAWCALPDYKSRPQANHRYGSE